MALQVFFNGDQNNAQGGSFWGPRMDELVFDNPVLYQQLSALSVELQAQFQGPNPVNPVFALKQDRHFTDAVWLFLGGYAPDRVDRFHVRLMRNRIGHGGADVKPRGMDQGFLEGQLTDAQNDVMVAALDYMTERSEELNAMLAGAHNHVNPINNAMAGPHMFLGGADMNDMDEDEDENDEVEILDSEDEEQADADFNDMLPVGMIGAFNDDPFLDDVVEVVPPEL